MIAVEAEHGSRPAPVYRAICIATRPNALPPGRLCLDHLPAGSLQPVQSHQARSPRGHLKARSPRGHGRLFTDSRCSPDCGEEDLDQECWFPPSSIWSHLNSANGLPRRIQRLNRRLRLEMVLLLNRAPLNKAPLKNTLQLTRLYLTRLQPRPLRLTVTLPTPLNLLRESGGGGVFPCAGLFFWLQSYWEHESL